MVRKGVNDQFLPLFPRVRQPFLKPDSEEKIKLVFDCVRIEIKIAVIITISIIVIDN